MVKCKFCDFEADRKKHLSAMDVLRAHVELIHATAYIKIRELTYSEYLEKKKMLDRIINF